MNQVRGHIPLISIIVPTLNSEMYITGCIESIINQTYTNFEIVVQDGGSKDGTCKIMSSIQKSLKNSNIQVVIDKDMGIYDAMNKAIQKAKGEWLMFLGSDDRLYSNTVLEEILCDKENEQFDVLYGNVHSSRFSGKYDGMFSAKKLLNQNICHQSILFRKNVFQTVGNFNVKYTMHADWDHNIRWFFNSKIRHKYVDLIVAEYADNGLSSLLGDRVFYEDKLKIYLKHAYAHLDIPSRNELLNMLIMAPYVSQLDRLRYKFLFHLNRIKIFN